VPVDFHLILLGVGFRNSALFMNGILSSFPTIWLLNSMTLARRPP
jgi:hypothetical protein